MPPGNDLLRQGSQWLDQMRTAHCSSPVIYRRAGQPDAQVNATFGKTDYEVADESGFTTGGHIWDFLVLADELWLAFGEPEASDTIIAEGRRFEVMAHGDDFRGWRWSDPYRRTYRIHTKDIGPPAPPDPGPPGIDM